MNKLGVLQGGYNVPADDMGGSPRPMPRPMPQRQPLKPMEASGNLPQAGRPRPMPRPGMNNMNVMPMDAMQPLPFKGRPQGQFTGQIRPMPRPGIGQAMGQLAARPMQPGAGAMNPQLQSQALEAAFQGVAAGGIPTRPMTGGGLQTSSLAGGIQPNKPYYR